MKEAEHVDPEKLRPYMGQWVALDQSGEQEIVVGSGTNAKAAVETAEAAGYKDVCLMFVPRGNLIATPFMV